jgi:hypothetical protein
MVRALRTRAALGVSAVAVTLTFVAAVPASNARPSSGQTRVNQDAALAVEFGQRVQQYMAVHEQVHEQGPVPALPKEATAEQIHQHQMALARAIQQLRPKAKPGEIFTKEIRAYFRRLLEGVFGGPEGRKLKAAIMDENPGAIRLLVNGRYPDGVPLTTMPPQVLAGLPKLPPELEYRFIGERLVLLDEPAHLIVDFIQDALPR